MPTHVIACTVSGTGGHRSTGLARLRALLDDGAALALRDLVPPRADGEARDGHATEGERA